MIFRQTKDQTPVNVFQLTKNKLNNFKETRNHFSGL